MRTLAQVILVRRDGAIILQHRPEVSGTPGSDIVTAFGGPAEPGETPAQTALAELRSTTNLRLKTNDLVFWREYPKRKPTHGADVNVFYFIAYNIASSELKVDDAEGLVILHSAAEASKINTTSLFRRVLSDYFHEMAKVKQHQPRHARV